MPLASLASRLGLAAAIAASFGCGSSGGSSSSTSSSSSGTSTTAQSSLGRATAPNVTPSDLAAAVAGNTAFATDLYHTLASGTSGNVFFSPYSISLALGMTYAGARTTTGSQMATTLHFTLPQDRLHPALDAIDLALESRGQGASGTNGQPFALNVANAVWGQAGFQLEQSYLDTLAVSYGAGLHLLDFVQAPGPAVATINGWVDTETHGKIPTLLGPSAVNGSTRLILTNAIYFDAAWKSQFLPAATTTGTFNAPSGAVTAQMMAQVGYFNYAAVTGAQAIELPYDGDQVSMVLIVPDAGTLATFESGFDATKLGAILGALSSTNVSLAMPKFDVDLKISLGATLAAMGMGDAFSSATADFTGIVPTPHELFISDVIHQATATVDENGTEAAAATAVVIATGAVFNPNPPVPLTVDRPFIFLIRDIPTGSVIFLGRVAQP